MGGLRHDDRDNPGHTYRRMDDGTPLSPTPRRSSFMGKSFAPGKLAKDPNEIRKSKRPLPSDARYDPLNPAHAPRTNAAASTLRSGNTPMAQFRHGDVVHWIANDWLYHGRILGLSHSHALVATRDSGYHTIPFALLTPGIHPEAVKS